MHVLHPHARFLQSWPTALEGTPAPQSLGTQERTLAFADTRFVFRGLSESLAATFDAHFGKERSEAGASASHQVELQYRTASADPFVAPSSLAWQYDLGLSFDASTTRMSGLHYVCEWSRELHATQVFVGPQLDDPVDVLENPFRLTCAYHLLHLGGVLLHSAGIASGERAIVCWGRSGAGKSTLSGLCQDHGLTVLSDELNALLPSLSTARPARTFRVQAMPFAGDLGRSGAPLQTYDLAGLFTLKQGDEPKLSALSDAHTFGTMAAAAPFVNTDPYVDTRLFNVLSQLLGRQQARLFTFPKSPAAVSFLKRAIFEPTP